MQNAVTISILLGLTWVFGFFAISGATFTFQLLFCLSNSLQGLAIFLLFCVRAEDVRRTLRPFFQWVKIPDMSRGTTYDISAVEKKNLSSSTAAQSQSVSMSTYNDSYQTKEEATDEKETAR